MKMNQKGFANIALIILILALAGTFGYFVFVKKSKSVIKQSPAKQTPTQPSATDSGQKPTTSDATEYPYILQPLSQTQLASLRSEFTASNKNICTQINEYGFTEFKSGCFSETVRIEITDETSIIEMVKNWLVQNSKLTGITKKSDLIVKSALKLNGCIKCEAPNFDKKVIGFRIDFSGQIYNGLPVEGDTSPLTVFANAKGISRIDGCWFPKITLPLETKISEVSAKNKLNGRTFTYGDIAGNPRNYRIEQKDLNNVVHKVIFVKKSSQGLEFRLAWKVTVGQGFFWTVYVDAITGEELKIIQMFQT